MARDIAITTVVIVLVHLYIVLSAVVYQALEGKTKLEPKHHYTEGYLLKTLNKPSLNMKNPNSREFKEFIGGYRDALQKDEAVENRRSFRSLTRAYLFALTSVTTVGNSGMTVTTVGGKSFYLASIITGILFYGIMLYRISLPLISAFRYAAENICCFTDEFGNLCQNFHPKITVVVMSNVFLIGSILLFAIGGVFSGHSYLYGLFTTYDSVLTVGNEKWLPLLAPWSETVFVISLSLFLLLELTLVFTTVLVSVEAALDSECQGFLLRIFNRGSSGGYQPIDQDSPHEVYSPLYEYQSSGKLDLAKEAKEREAFEDYDFVMAGPSKKPITSETPRPQTLAEEAVTGDQQAPLDSSNIYETVDSGKPVDLVQSVDSDLRKPASIDDDVFPKSPGSPTQVVPIRIRPPSVVHPPSSPPLVTPTATIPPSASQPLYSPPSPSSEPLAPESPPSSPKYPSFSTPVAAKDDVQPPEATEPDQLVPSPDPFYEVYEPQNDRLAVPKRTSSESSGESEYSNISVSDYEHSLAAELEKSRDFAEEQRKKSL